MTGSMQHTGTLWGLRDSVASSKARFLVPLMPHNSFCGFVFIIFFLFSFSLWPYTSVVTRHFLGSAFVHLGQLQIKFYLFISSSSDLLHLAI